MTALQLQFPPDLHYLLEHQVWARLDGDGLATVGITALGIALSGEIYMCRPKRLGTALAQGATLAVVELAKSIVAVKTPVSGSIVAINPALEQRPGLVHTDPYGAGWIAQLALTEAVASAISNLDNGMNQVLATQASIGARLNVIDTLSTENESLQIANASSQSTIRDTDMAEAISRLTLQMTKLEAAQASFVRISQLSLFNKM